MTNLILRADGLLSKWGFRDGDVLSEYLYENMTEYNEYTAVVKDHHALEELVKRYLLPKLKKKVEIQFIETIHNPVRAEMIDGIYYTNHYDWDDEHLLGDISVEITPEQIQEVMQMKKEVKK